MSPPNVMIGLMQCTVGGLPAGSIKNSSINIKPKYKEHIAGYPQISDLKALLYTEGICSVESEEHTVLVLVKQIATGLLRGLPIEVSFEGKAPGINGTALTIAGVGFGSGSSLTGVANDFGSCGIITTCLDLAFSSTPNIATNIIVVPDFAAQAITLNANNLIFGAPKVNGVLCTKAKFQSNSAIKYICYTWPPVIDAAILESSSFEISASLEAPNSDDINTCMIPGSIQTPITRTLAVPTVGNEEISVAIDAILEADISFSPGNDWNGIDVKYTALLIDPTKIGTNWANLT